MVPSHLFAIMIYRLTENQIDLSVKQCSLKNDLRSINLKGLQGLFCWLGTASCSILPCAKPPQESSLKLVTEGKK